MEKQEMLKIAKSCNFYQDKELKDLSGNTFVSFRNEATDLIFIYRDQKDGKIADKTGGKIKWITSSLWRN